MAPPSSSRTDYLKSSRKFDVPLFCGAWAPKKVKGRGGAEKGDGEASDGPSAKNVGSDVGCVILAGGGGEGKHGVKNRIVVAQYSFSDAELLSSAYQKSTGEDAAFRLAVHPNGDAVLGAFSKTCKAFEWNPEEEEKLVESERKLGGLEVEDGGEQKFVIFSPDGSRVASGREDGRLRVLDWPDMTPVLDVEKAHTSSLKDADFNLDGTLLATTADVGPCRVWDIAGESAVATLSIPEKGRLGLCRFSREESQPFLFATAVKGGKGYIVVWDSITWKLLGVKRVSDDPISALAVSPDSQFLATGSAAGDVGIVEVKTMKLVQVVKSAHMVFTTGVDFSPDSRFLLSVSGDSSARVTAVKSTKLRISERQAYLLLLVLVLISALLAYLFTNSDVAQSFFQFPLGRDQPAKPPPEAWM